MVVLKIIGCLLVVLAGISFWPFLCFRHLRVCKMEPCKQPGCNHMVMRCTKCTHDKQSGCEYK